MKRRDFVRAGGAAAGASALLPRYAEPHPNVEVVRVALTEGAHAHDLAEMRRAAQARPDRALIYVCNPNNPTGTLTPVSSVRSWIDEAPREHTFVVDEAYHDFVDDPAYETLDEVGLSHMRSHTNFVMHEIGTDVETYNRRMLEAGIRVGRPFPPYRRRSRVSLGSPEEMERWAGTLRDFRDRGWV